MQPMTGPPMPGMAMPPRPAIRQGSSRIVPVVVSAGLAVGVFCGLLFGLGTGKRGGSADAATPTDPVAEQSATAVPKPVPPTAATGAASTAATGSGSAGAAATGSAGGMAAGSAEPAASSTKLVVEIKPEAAAAVARVSIDDQDISGMEQTIPLSRGQAKQKVHVRVTAPGYKDAEGDVELEAPSVSAKFELNKLARTPPIPTGDTTAPPTNPKPPGGNKSGEPRPKPKTGKPGLIDI
jgi:hypothetical protein